MPDSARTRRSDVNGGTGLADRPGRTPGHGEMGTGHAPAPMLPVSPITADRNFEQGLLDRLLAAAAHR